MRLCPVRIRDSFLVRQLVNLTVWSPLQETLTNGGSFSKPFALHKETKQMELTESMPITPRYNCSTERSLSGVLVGIGRILLGNASRSRLLATLPGACLMTLDLDIVGRAQDQKISVAEREFQVNSSFCGTEGYE